MKLQLHTVSRDGVLYKATAEYADGFVTVKAGSKVNILPGENFKASPEVESKRNDSSIVDLNGIVLKDIVFSSLSTAACFVTGRSANGMITWKTPDNRYVRYAIKGE